MLFNELRLCNILFIIPITPDCDNSLIFYKQIKLLGLYCSQTAYCACADLKKSSIIIHTPNIISRTI